MLYNRIYLVIINFSQFALFAVFLFLANQSIAQDCPLPSATKVLQGNNISANILLGGDLFWDREEEKAHFQVPMNQYPNASSLFNQGLWVAAYDNQNELKISAVTYTFPSGIRKDYSAGPIINNNGQLEFECENYNHLWEVFGYEIQQHISDFEDNGIIDNPIPNIFDYPAQQNPFFENITGFQLQNEPQGLAPFFDNNNDGIYDPEDGDFPKPSSVDKDVIPSHIIWGIFNDARSVNVFNQTSPLNIEVHLTTWSFLCEENEILNNSIFTTHKIINRGNSSLNDMLIGFGTQTGLGCSQDDYFGSIPNLNTYYFYNSALYDNWLPSCEPNYGTNPPVQAVTILNKKLESMTHSYLSSSFSDYPNGMLIPTQPIEYYNYLNGFWRDGNPITIAGSGYNPNIPNLDTSNYVFFNLPINSSGWSMHTANLPYGGEFISISGIKADTLFQGEVFEIDRGFTFHQTDTLNFVETTALVESETPILQQMYDDNFIDYCNNNTCFSDCVWTGDADRDSIVTTCDFLQVALAIGETGSERNKPMIWQPFSSDNWNISQNDIDLKHTDCSGNGMIDGADFEMSGFHFGKSYKTVPSQDVYPTGNELTIENHSSTTLRLDSLDVGKIGRIKCVLNLSEEIFGIAFTVEYNPNYLNYFDSFSFSPWDNNANLEYFDFQKSIQENGEYHYVYVKTNHENTISDEGGILQLFLTAKQNEFEQVQTLVRLKNIKAILNDGTDLNYGAQDFVVNIFNPDGNGIILNDEKFEKEQIQIFPNPTTDLLNIKFSNPTKSKIVIFDIYGKRVFEKEENSKSHTSIAIDQLSIGIYFLQIEKEGQSIVRKFTKM